MRIAIMGGPGSGKTTLGRTIAAATGWPHIELDALFHGPEWTPTPRGVFRERVLDAIGGAAWVVDGNYRSRLDTMVESRADIVVLLDLGRAVTMRRLAWRSARRGLLRTSLWNGNRERLFAVLSRDPTRNLVLWGWQNFPRYHEKMLAAQEHCGRAGTAVVRLTTPARVRRWTESFLREQAATRA